MGGSIMTSDFYLILGLLMAGVSVYLFLSSLLSTNETAQALSWASGDEPVKSDSKFIEGSRPLVHKFTLGLASKVKNLDYRRRVKRKIQTSGLERELNVDEFIGIQILWGLVFPFALILMNFTLELGYPMPLVLILGAFGAYFPHLHCDQKRKSRYTSVVSDLPFFIDLLALSTEAGLDFFAAIERIVDKAEDSVLAGELKQALQDVRLGSSRAEALKKISDRLDIPEITSFVVVVTDADSQGVSISKVLKQQAQQMRLERFTRAEKAGARASQLILVPLLLFILPAVMIMVFGPIILQFIGGNS
jgi:tight adherence protein C